LNGLFSRELDVAQEIRVNQYKTASFVLIYSCLVIFVYSKLNSGSIQPPPSRASYSYNWYQS